MSTAQAWDMFAESLNDMMRGERAARDAIQNHADWCGAISYLATVMEAMRELDADHPALRDDVRRAIWSHGRRISLADNHHRPSFNPWDYTSHELYRPPHEVAAVLDRQAQEQREVLLATLQASQVSPKRRLRWYWLWMWGPAGVVFLDGWWPQAEADNVHAWRERLISHVRAQWNRPGPCPTLHQLVREVPATPLDPKEIFDEGS